MWGKANQVEFEPTKESIHVLARCGGTDGFFKILGAKFDSQLLMRNTMHETAHGASWKVRAILQMRRFVSTPELVVHYKTRALPFIEARTSAIYHCCDSSIHGADMVQARFLSEVGMDEREALF